MYSVSCIKHLLSYRTANLQDHIIFFRLLLQIPATVVLVLVSATCLVFPILLVIIVVVSRLLSCRAWGFRFRCYGSINFVQAFVSDCSCTVRKTNQIVLFAPCRYLLLVQQNGVAPVTLALSGTCKKI